jgi:hypothetical protein
MVIGKHGIFEWLPFEHSVVYLFFGLLFVIPCMYFDFPNGGEKVKNQALKQVKNLKKSKRVNRLHCL